MTAAGGWGGPASREDRWWPATAAIATAAADGVDGGDGGDRGGASRTPSAGPAGGSTLVVAPALTASLPPPCVVETVAEAGAAAAAKAEVAKALASSVRESTAAPHAYDGDRGPVDTSPAAVYEVSFDSPKWGGKGVLGSAAAWTAGTPAAAAAVAGSWSTLPPGGDNVGGGSDVASVG
ncbi:hypothetical protein MMPV_001321 [Pyropia vietnamensis]